MKNGSRQRRFRRFAVRNRQWFFYIPATKPDVFDEWFDLMAMRLGGLAFPPPVHVRRWPSTYPNEVAATVEEKCDR